jgi:hypothetical protein
MNNVCLFSSQRQFYNTVQQQHMIHQAYPAPASVSTFQSIRALVPALSYLQALAAPSDPYTLPSPTGQLPRSIKLYQYEVCPFCCKVKAFLDYHKVR